MPPVSVICCWAAARSAPSANTTPNSAIHFSALQLPLAKIALVLMSQSPPCEFRPSCHVHPGESRLSSPPLLRPRCSRLIPFRICPAPPCAPWANCQRTGSQPSPSGTPPRRLRPTGSPAPRVNHLSSAPYMVSSPTLERERAKRNMHYRATQHQKRGAAGGLACLAGRCAIRAETPKSPSAQDRNTPERTRARAETRLRVWPATLGPARRPGRRAGPRAGPNLAADASSMPPPPRRVGACGTGRWARPVAQRPEKGVPRTGGLPARGLL